MNDIFIFTGISGGPLALVRLGEVAGAFIDNEYLRVNTKAGGLMAIRFATPQHASHYMEKLVNALNRPNLSEMLEGDFQKALQAEAKRIGGEVEVCPVADTTDHFLIRFKEPNPDPGEIYGQWEGDFRATMEILKHVEDGEGDEGVVREICVWESQQQV